MPPSPSRRGDYDGPLTVLLAPASNVLFHVGRTLMVAGELAKRGHRVVIAGEPRYLQDPAVTASLDFEYELLPDFTPEEGMELLRAIHRMPARHSIERMIDAELELLRRLEPDLVVADFRPTLSISARARGVPLASLLLGHWLPEYAANPEWVPRTYPIGDLIGRTLGARLGRRLASPTFRTIIRYKTTPFRAAARARGQTPPALLWDFLKGDLDVLSDIDELCELPSLPGRHRVGPVVWEPRMALPPWVHELDRTRPILLANFGSTAHPDVFRRTLEAFADEPYQVILATCGQIEPEDFSIPDNFFVSKFLPMAQMVELADLVVYHGGAGTFHQTLLAGVPGIVIATHWDQEHAGFVSERLRIGRFFTMREILRAPHELVDAVREILANHEGYRERLGHLHRRLQQFDGPKAAAELLETFARERARA